MTRYEFDSNVSMEWQSGVDTINYKTAQVQHYDNSATVVLFLKILLEQVKLDKPFTGGIGSYKLYVLLAYHFEKHLTLGGKDTPEEMLLSFFFRFGNVGDAYDGHDNDRTRINSEAFTQITSQSIIRSNGGEADLSSAFRIDECVAIFGMCFQRLMLQLQRQPDSGDSVDGREKCTSVLGCIINADALEFTREGCIKMVDMFQEPLPVDDDIDREEDLDTDVDEDVSEGTTEQQERGQITNEDETENTATTKVAAMVRKVSSHLFQRPSKSSSTIAIATDIAKPKKTPTVAPKTRHIHVKVVSGPYKGSDYHLHPIKRRPCLVGSSSSRKFRKHGISLPNDEMVSINQGKFELGNGGTAYYTDNDGVPLLLKEGMELTVGSGVLKISLVDGDAEEVVEEV